MSSRQQLNAYLARVEKRLRLSTCSRGVAATAVLLVVATVLLVLLTNHFAFSPRSVRGARFLLILAIASSAAFAIVRPLLRLNRRNAAGWLEARFPAFQERLLTFVERSREAKPDVFLELLAADTLALRPRAEPSRVLPWWRIAASVATSVVGVTVLLWLVTGAPGFLGHGAALLWGATPHIGSRPFYDIQVVPGDATVRKGGDQIIKASPVGFQVSRVRLFARFRSASKWDEAEMLPQENGPAFQFLFAGISEPVEYYVQAGDIASRRFHLNVLDLPSIKRIRVTYHYPAWAGLKDVVQEQTGDLRAVEGSEADVAIEFDRPLRQGALALDGESSLPLQRGAGNWAAARVPIRKDGVYHVEAIEDGKNIRLSEDFFISAGKETPPVVIVKRPGRDARVSPIEEVTVEVQAEDDFALEAMDLRYSVNGGPEKTVPLLARKGRKEASGSTVITLEDYKLVPGDLVSLYALARDTRNTTRTDMFFLEAQPYEREYTQSQQSGDMAGAGGDGQRQDQVSQRQKEIISATWNQWRNAGKDRASAAANAKFLADMQGKLRDQARSLAQRMRSRELSAANEEFSSFSKDMEAAAEAMNTATGRLKGQNWKDALSAEQRALQYLLRAEATYREIQVAFGRQGGGGSGMGSGRDLENLFDLELDTEKNQYETGQRTNTADQRQKEIDEALQKLEQLARRQQELAAQQAQQKQQTFQQRWQQEMLRREAEQLQRQMQQLARGSSSQPSDQQQSAQQPGGRQSSSRSASSGQGSMQQRLSQLSGRNQPEAGEQRIREALRRLEQAANDMRRATENGQNSADPRRAAERLQEARDLVAGLRRQEAAGQVGDLVERAERLASRQKSSMERLRKQLPGKPGEPGPNTEQAGQMASEKEQMLGELGSLERDMQNAVGDMAGTQRATASKLREALGGMQQDELAMRMKIAAELIRRGFWPLLSSREATLTLGLERLRDQLRAAQDSLGGTNEQGELERGLAQVEELRGQWSGGGFDRAQGLRALDRIRRGFESDHESKRAVEDVIREVERRPTQAAAALERLELLLRRKIEEKQAGQSRTGAGDRIPSGYADAVAEYFRRLSRGK